MKLSDVKGERTFDVLAEIFDDVAVIAKDKKVTKAFRKRPLPKGMTRNEFGVQVALEATSAIVSGHKAEIERILAALAGVSVEEYVANIDGIKIVNDVVDLISDPELQTLFFSQVQSTETSSGPASGNTEGQKT
ncbi:MAG: hypothetical protein LUD72_10775 [Bacteroidales bacterium]|nr:hypothetical protein [Bacteroidales bacterium]